MKLECYDFKKEYRQLSNENKRKKWGTKKPNLRKSLKTLTAMRITGLKPTSLLGTITPPEHKLPIKLTK